MRRLGSRFGMSIGVRAGLAGALSVGAGACGSGFTTSTGDGNGNGNGNASGADAAGGGSSEGGSTAGSDATTGGARDSGDGNDGSDATDGSSAGARDGGGGGGDTSDGSCVDDCQGAAYVALTGGTINDLVLGPNDVLWVESGNEYHYAPYGSSAYADAESSAFTVSGITDLAASGSTAYLAASGSSDDNADLIAIPIGGAATSAVLANPNEPVAAAAFVGTGLYTIESGAVYRHPASSFGSETAVGVSAVKLGGAGNYLFFENNGGGFFAIDTSLTAAMVDALFTGTGGETFDFAASDHGDGTTNIFWFDAAAGELKGCTFDAAGSAANAFGCGTMQSIAAVATFAGVAAYGDDVYWIDTGASTPGVYYAHTPRVGTATNTIGGPFTKHRIASAANAINNDSFANLAVNAKSIVWSQYFDNDSTRVILRVDTVSP